MVSGWLIIGCGSSFISKLPQEKVKFCLPAFTREGQVLSPSFHERERGNGVKKRGRWDTLHRSTDPTTIWNVHICKMQRTYLKACTCHSIAGWMLTKAAVAWSLHRCSLLLCGSLLEKPSQHAIQPILTKDQANNDTKVIHCMQTNSHTTSPPMKRRGVPLPNPFGLLVF